ncbi:hypothetical protein CS063_02000 [Sporanaerobium hydrogeniformans]|uniref:Uncharacterized protein n=1 Tax=Sporanaerobium hydrogeniformans TaxID=3072179 RepID=A0AC61DKW8_9FIRM|nr:epoxyqueuosine reductase QueH [Sporanaerobium hydrogeniformans]PHV72272.1 hypothetical protein CS063_02000 [Sporanaerobium hydrogeniformans]
MEKQEKTSRQKVNYQKKLEATLVQLEKESKVPTLLLHSCCAPCSTYVIEYLSQHFYVTVFYYNPNIDEKEEYAKRSKEQRHLIEVMPTRYPVQFIEGPYEVEAFTKKAQPLREEQEGGARCTMCYGMRLAKTAQYAKEGNFDYFTTTLSISPLKDAIRLNAIGEALGEKWGVSYLLSDFKKKEGYKRSTLLSETYGLYRQDYCGCSYSKRQS